MRYANFENFLKPPLLIKTRLSFMVYKVLGTTAL